MISNIIKYRFWQSFLFHIIVVITVIILFRLLNNGDNSQQRH